MRAGIENTFKTARRLVKKGSENGVIGVGRLFDALASSAVKAFPNVKQEQITSDDRERCWGRGALEELRPYVAHMNRQRTGLGKRMFGPTHKTQIKKPEPGHKTCGASAHSRQVAYEECLVQLEIHPDGHFVDLAPITRSLAAGLVHTVAATAPDLDSPVVLADVRSGRCFLAVLQLSRCVMGWPLKVLCVDPGVFGLTTLLDLHPLIITDPCLPSILKCTCSRVLTYTVAYIPSFSVYDVRCTINQFAEVPVKRVWWPQSGTVANKPRIVSRQWYLFLASWNVCLGNVCLESCVLASILKFGCRFKPAS